MTLLEEYVARDGDELRKQGVRGAGYGRPRSADVAGPRGGRPIQQDTAAGTALLLNICLSYGSRAELVRAARCLAEEVAAGRLRPEEIDEAAITARLYTAGLPDPDLVIRTSGEHRLSNFLLWQLAYAEFYRDPGPLARLHPQGSLRGDRGVQSPGPAVRPVCPPAA